MIEKIIKGIVLKKFILEDEWIIKILSEGGNIISLKIKTLDKNVFEKLYSLKKRNIVEVVYFSSVSSLEHDGRIKNSKIIKDFKNENEMSEIVFNIIKNITLTSNNHSILIYKSIEEIINLLDKNNFYFQHILAFLIIILRQNSYQVTIDKCAKCEKRDNIIFFSLYDGGLICKEHLEIDEYNFSHSTIKKIIEINLLKNPFECRNLNFSSTETQKIKWMYKTFFENQMGINLYMIDKIL